MKQSVASGIPHHAWKATQVVREAPLLLMMRKTGRALFSLQRPSATRADCSRIMSLQHLQQRPRSSVQEHLLLVSAILSGAAHFCSVEVAPIGTWFAPPEMRGLHASTHGACWTLSGTAGMQVMQGQGSSCRH